MPIYTGTYRWLNPATHSFEPVTVRGRYNSADASISTLTYRDVYFSPTPVPDPPIIVTARMDTQTQSTIEWQDGYNTGNVISYTVRRDGSDVSGPLDPSIQTFSETGLPTAIPNPVFTYTVEALTDQGLSPPSDGFPVQWQTPPGTRRPFPPTNTRINLATVTEVSGDVLWDMSTDPSILGFRVYRNGVPGIPIVDLLDSTARTYTITGLSPATTYSGINVRAYNSVGESGASTFTSFTTVDPGGFVSRFPGHQAGLVYLGVYSANAYGTEDTPIGTTVALDRIIDSGVTGTVTQHVVGFQTEVDLATLDGKMPWISLQPAHLGLSGTDSANWNAIAASSVDGPLQQYFDMIGELTADFVMLTFQPMYSWSALTDTTAAQYCDAINYIGDAWASYNQKANGIYGPIVGSDYYQAVQAAQRAPGQLINDNLLDTSEFLGIDIYQDNKTPQPASSASARLNYIIGQYQALTSHDTIMMALGEVAGANVFRLGGLYKGVTIPASSTAPTGSQWLQDALGYVFSNRARFFAVSAFDTSGLTTSPKWALDETSVTTGPGTLDTVTKMAVYQTALNGSQIARQQGETVKTPISVTAVLNNATPHVGDTMQVTVTETVKGARTLALTDTGTTWTKTSDNGITAVYTAPAPTVTGAHSVSVKVTRTFDGKTATTVANYTVSAPVVVTMLQGVSLSDVALAPSISPRHGGFTQWDAVRCYDFTKVDTAMNTFTGLKTICLSWGSPRSDGTAAASDLNAFLNSFYNGASGYTFPYSLATRQAMQVHFANGNEYSDKFGNGTNNPIASGQVAAWVDCMTKLRAVVNNYPKASLWLDPTQDHESSDCVRQSLDPVAHLLDGVAWSMYPPGRGNTAADPTYNKPSYVEADRTNQKLGFLIRCFYRTYQAQLVSRTTIPGHSLKISCWEVGIGDDPNDSTHRPYYAANRLAGGMQHLADQYSLQMPIQLWWDNQSDSGSPQNCLSSEPSSTNPSTAQAWRNWRNYNPLYGGTAPAAWASNPKSSWKGDPT